MNYKTVTSDGTTININVVCSFKVESLNKEYIAYSIVDDNEENSMGAILLSELVIDGDNISVLDINVEERDLVLALYNEIKTQMGKSNE